MLGTQIPSIQGFGASNFHTWQWKIGEMTLKTFIESFQEGHDNAYDVSHQSVFFNYLSYLLANLENFP